jgi:hypothetical protein
MTDRPASEEIEELTELVTPEMVAEFERILRESAVGYDKSIWTQEVAYFLYLFRQFRRNHAQFPF